MRCHLLMLVFATALLSGLNAGISVQGNRLFDSTGQEIMMRGVNIPHAWFPAFTTTAIRHAQELGSNTVRLVLANGGRWEKIPARELQLLLDECEFLGVLAVLEVHDSTGYGSQEGAVPMSTAVDYWLEMADVLRGREHAVIINIANEPFGNYLPPSDWIDGHREAIKRLREAGLHHALMVDAASWGQDWEGITRKHAPEVFEADPLKNVLFSVHMYEVYPTAESVDAYFKSFQELGLCLIVGEFADTHFEKPVAAEAILTLSELHGIGYLGWSWCGNGSPLEILDLVLDWDPKRLTPWGELLFNHPAGIRATSRPVLGIR
jgi:mannan endo-1,4-beta-mannosidase